MATIQIELPSILAKINEGRASFSLQATTLRNALDTLKREHPRLAVHLFDESGAFRQHVLCFHNNMNTRWLETLDRPLAENDKLRFLQAVSGG